MIFNFQTIKPFLQKHGPTILTGLAMCGVVVTGYLTHRADKKVISEACEAILFTDDADIPIEETVGRCMKKNWKNYIPPVITGLATMGCILGSNQWHLSKEGTLAAAALMYKTSGEELEKAFNEKFGDEEVKKMKQEIAEAKADRDRPPWEEKPEKKIKVWDPYTRQYLNVSQTDILWAETTVNRWLFNCEEVEYSKLIGLLGGKPINKIKNFGWYIDDTFCWNSSYIHGGGSIQIWVEMIDGQLTLCYPIEPYDFSESL